MLPVSTGTGMWFLAHAVTNIYLLSSFKKEPLFVSSAWSCGAIFPGFILLMPRLLNYLMIGSRLTAQVPGIWCNFPFPVKPAFPADRSSHFPVIPTENCVMDFTSGTDPSSPSPFIGRRIISVPWFVICWSGRTVFYGNVLIGWRCDSSLSSMTADSIIDVWRRFRWRWAVNSQLLQTIIFLSKKGEQLCVPHKSVTFRIKTWSSKHKLPHDSLKNGLKLKRTIRKM